MLHTDSNELTVNNKKPCDDEQNIYGNAVSLIGKYASPNGIHLDIGCGFGAIAEFVSKIGLQYIGCDFNDNGLISLKERNFEAHRINLLELDSAIEIIENIIGTRKLSSISVLNVLEYLTNGPQYLAALRKVAFTYNALLVIAVPNIAHQDISFKLLTGRFDYTATGLLDYKQIFFYTDQTLRDITSFAGWRQIDAFDVVGKNSDQKFPKDNVILNDAPLFVEYLAAIKKSSDKYRITQQFVRAYLPGSVGSGDCLTKSDALESSVFLSVIVRTQGKRIATLRDALLCLSAQSCQDFEIIVVVHKSSFEQQVEVKKVVAELPFYMKAKIKVVLDQEGERRAIVLNKAIGFASGYYVVALDDASLMLADWVENYKNLAEENYGKALRAVSVEQEVEEIKYASWQLTYKTVSKTRRIYPSAFNLLDHFEYNRTPLMSWAFPRSIFRDYSFKFDESLRTCDDWDLAMQAALFCGAKNSAKITSIYRKWRMDRLCDEYSQEAWLADHRKIIDKLDAMIHVFPSGTIKQIAKMKDQIFVYAEEKKRMEQRMLADAENRRRIEKQMEMALERVVNSISWKITKPLRLLGAVAKKIKHDKVKFYFEKMEKEIVEMEKRMAEMQDRVRGAQLLSADNFSDATKFSRFVSTVAKKIKNEKVRYYLEKAAKNDPLVVGKKVLGYFAVKAKTALKRNRLFFNSNIKKNEIKGNNYKKNKYDVIFFSIINWDFRTQRPQHLAKKFWENGHRIFYISVNFSKGDTYQLREIAENLYEINLPMEKEHAIYNADIYKEFGLPSAAMDKIFTDFAIKESVSIVEFPLWFPLAEYLKRRWRTKIIFDCLDEFSEFDNVSPETLVAEKKLVAIADCCVASSMKLYEKNKLLCEHVKLVRNAAEFERFSCASDDAVLKHIKKPIVGYYGAIAEWFDAEIIEYVAQVRPNYSIVLIGHTTGSDMSRLKRLKNVHLLGEKPYRKLPGYLHSFDVCLIPFKICDLIKSTDPVKFYEYLSAGKPIVSTKLPELLPYSDLLYLVDNKDAFLKGVDLALAEDNPATIAKRVKFAKENDWTHRFHEMDEAIKATYPLVSIIVVTFNNCEYTKLCVESIYQKSAYPNLELIIVDNASSDNTREYLTAVQKQYDSLKIVFNDENRGFAAANNIGIKASSGKYVILLNNDTVVTSGWIDGLIKYLEDDGTIGVVGPVTNSIGNEAKINVDYSDMSYMDAFAASYTARHKDENFDIAVLAMFCVAFRRETIDKVGLLDESFAIGMFEDDDYSMRIKQHGLRVVCVEDVFIHHFGGASFNKLESKEYKEIFAQNKKRYEEKWGNWQPHKYRKGVVS